LQPCADGLGDARAAGFLGFVEKLSRYFHSDLSNRFHKRHNYTILNTSI